MANDAGYFRVSNKLLEHLHDMKHGEKSVYIVIARYADGYDAEDDRYAWPSQDLIAEKAGMDVRSVSRALHDLEHRGLIAIIPPGTPMRPGDPAVTNRYVIRAIPDAPVPAGRAKTGNVRGEALKLPAAPAWGGPGRPPGPDRDVRRDRTPRSAYNTYENTNTIHAKRPIQTPPPDEMPVDDRIVGIALAVGISCDLHAEVPRFLQYARDNGYKSADWYITFEDWLRRKLRFDPKTHAPRTSESSAGNMSAEQIIALRKGQFSGTLPA